MPREWNNDDTEYKKSVAKSYNYTRERRYCSIVSYQHGIQEMYGVRLKLKPVIHVGSK